MSLLFVPYRSGRTSYVLRGICWRNLAATEEEGPRTPTGLQTEQVATHFYSNMHSIHDMQVLVLVKVHGHYG